MLDVAGPAAPLQNPLPEALDELGVFLHIQCIRAPPLQRRGKSNGRRPALSARWKSAPRSTQPAQRALDRIMFGRTVERCLAIAVRSIDIDSAIARPISMSPSGWGRATCRGGYSMVRDPTVPAVGDATSRRSSCFCLAVSREQRTSVCEREAHDGGLAEPRQFGESEFTLAYSLSKASPRERRIKGPLT